MDQLKQHQPPMTVDEQIENLKKLGLIIKDEEYVNIPDHFEPPVRRMRATIPEFQSHRSGN